MKIIAHRCGTDVYPQQTIHSARHSIKLGVDFVEVDIRFTLDNIPVVIHDATPQSLYGLDTPVCEMTAEHFLSLRRTDDKAFCGHSFGDYLDCGIENMLFHIKEGGDRLDTVLDMCAKYGILDKVVFGVTEIDDVRRVKAYSDSIKVLGFMHSPDDTQAFAQTGADYIRLWQKWLTDEKIESVRRTGKELWIMAKNGDVGECSEEDYRLFDSIKADGILVNDIEPALRFFGK